MVKKDRFIDLGLKICVGGLVLIFLILFLGLMFGYISVNLPASSFNKYSGYTLELSDDVKSFLVKNYDEKIEHGACLNGSINNNYEFFVSSISSYVTGTNNSVYINCYTMGHIHSHPKGHGCYASNGDILAWKDYVNNGVVLFLIQCSPNKFVVYTSEHLNMRYNYEI